MKKKQTNVLKNTFLPVIITFALIELSEKGSGFCDVVITSRMLGSLASGAMGLGYPLFSFLGILSGLISLGLQSVCSEEMGKGNIDKMNKVFTGALGVSIVISFLFLLFLTLFRMPFALFLGAPADNADNLLNLCCDYLRGLSYGLIPLFLYPVIAPLVQLDGSGSLVRIAVILGTATDIIGNIAFIKLGLDVFGVGLASSLSYYVTFLTLCGHFLKKKHQLRLNFSQFSFSDMKEIFNRGKNKAFRRVANMIRPIIINKYIISIGGGIAMSALSIRNNTADMLMSFNTGIASSVSTLAGVIYSERSLNDMKYLGKLAHKYIYLFNLPLALICLFFANPIASFLVTDDAVTRELVCFAVRVFSAEMIFNVLIASRVSYLNAVKQYNKASLLTFSYRLLAVVPFVFLLGSTMGARGVILSTCAGYAFMVLLILVYTIVKKKKLIPSIEDYLIFDNKLLDSPKDTIELPIRDINDASLVSEQISLFCKGHKFDEKKTYFSSLCMDEVANFIINRAEGKDINLELFLRIDKDDLILRFRYNGLEQNPFMDKNDDDLALVGIKIVQKKAKEIKTFRIFKINYVVVKF